MRVAVLAMVLAACGGRGPDGGGALGRGEPATRASSGPPAVDAPATTNPPPLGPPTQAQLDRVVLRPVRVVNLAEPVALAVAGDGRTLYVGERAGRVRAVREGRLDPRPLLDLSGEVAVEGEGGLLGVAVAPDGGHLYASFTDRRRAVRLIEVALGPGGADPGSRRDVLSVPQPSVRHHGGNLVFGPDGLLWLGLGDGSEGGDPENAAQSLAVLRGKLLRLAPTPTATAGYTVPRTNPFVGRRGARGEIWAYGLRNPWRFSFDRATGDLWIGDVGQYVVEEIDTVSPRRAAGANFGWNRLEGRRRFTGSPPPRAVPPVYQYNHNGGRCAVIGGYVYRGRQVDGLQGAYVYGDLCDGRVRALARGPGGALRHRDLGVRIPGLASFAEDGAGELYALSLGGGVYRLTPGG
jgi:glucose/arabinose dehydrogenase